MPPRVTVVGGTEALVRAFGRALEGVDLEAAGEVVDLLDDPELMGRYGERPLQDAPVVLAEIRSRSTQRGLVRPRTQGRSAGRSRRARSGTRSGPVRSTDDDPLPLARRRTA